MKNQSGRSLFEMIVVIGIVGLLTVTGISGLGGGTANMRANALQYDIEEVAKRIIELNAWNRDGTFDRRLEVDLDGTVFYDTSPNHGNNSIGYSACSACPDEQGTTSCCAGFTITTPALNERVCELLLTKSFANVDPPNINCANGTQLIFTSN